MESILTVMTRSDPCCQAVHDPKSCPPRHSRAFAVSLMIFGLINIPGLVLGFLAIDSLAVGRLPIMDLVIRLCILVILICAGFFGLKNGECKTCSKAYKRASVCLFVLSCLSAWVGLYCYEADTQLSPDFLATLNLLSSWIFLTASYTR